MIIEFQVFSKDYKKEILNCGRSFDYTCPKCGAKANFYRHGTYSRSVTYLSDTGEVLFETLDILRIQCQSCDSTHGILPSDAIPFQVYSLPVVLFLCGEIFINKASIRSTARKMGCAVQTVCQKLSLLKRCLALIEFFLRQASLYTAAVSVPPAQALALLLSPDMKFSSYYRCHGHPLFLDRRSTVSYPLYFSAAFSG